MNPKRKIYEMLAVLSLRLHNFSYKLASRLAVRAEGGVHPKHRLTNYHRFFLDNIASGDVILDAGCGGGELSFDLAQKAKRVTGIDINEKNIESAKKKYSAPNLEYIVGDITKDIPPSRNFDVVILSNVLEHIENRDEFLKRIKPLAPKILIRVPLFDRDWITPYKKEMGLEWRADKTHYIEYTLDSFNDELGENGLALQKYVINFGEIWAVVK